MKFRIAFLLPAILTMALPAAYAGCSSPSGVAGNMNWISANSDYEYCDGSNWTSTTVSATANACTTAGLIQYVSGTNDLEYCNGSLWVSMNGASTQSSCSGTTAGTYTYNSTGNFFQWCDGSNWKIMRNTRGFFVLTSATYTGALGGLTGANTKCLTDLTNNTFLNKSLAAIDSVHVKAFLCDGSSCNNPLASTVYYFAHSGSATDGGSSFTANGSGVGSNESGNWSGTTYFNNAATYWTGRASTSNTQWASSSTAFCTSGTPWNDSSGGPSGRSAVANSTTSSRWTNSSSACNSTLNLICLVNP